MMRRLLVFMAALIFIATASAGALYPFHTPEKQARFDLLSQQLRCLVCQNENLAASQAPLAIQLRQQVYQMVKQGKSVQQIKSYMTSRYGDFVLFKPPVTMRTCLLWFGPFLLFLAGFFILFFVIRLRRADAADEQLSSSEQQRLEELLNQ